LSLLGFTSFRIGEIIKRKIAHWPKGARLSTNLGWVSWAQNDTGWNKLWSLQFFMRKLWMAQRWYRLSTSLEWVQTDTRRNKLTRSESILRSLHILIKGRN
jgi:hypothetical protein